MLCRRNHVVLIQAGFETLVKADTRRRWAYFECLHELYLSSSRVTNIIYEGEVIIDNMRLAP